MGFRAPAWESQSGEERKTTTTTPSDNPTTFWTLNQRAADDGHKRRLLHGNQIIKGMRPMLMVLSPIKRCSIRGKSHYDFMLVVHSFCYYFTAVSSEFKVVACDERSKLDIKVLVDCMSSLTAF